MDRFHGLESHCIPIRALNMAPECVVGQLRPLDTDAMVEEQMTLQKKSFAGAWENRLVLLEYEYVMQQRRDAVVTIDWEDGTGKQEWCRSLQNDF